MSSSLALNGSQHDFPYLVAAGSSVILIALILFATVLEFLGEILAAFINLCSSENGLLGLPNRKQVDENPHMTNQEDKKFVEPNDSESTPIRFPQPKSLTPSTIIHEIKPTTFQDGEETTLTHIEYEEDNKQKSYRSPCSHSNASRSSSGSSHASSRAASKGTQPKSTPDVDDDGEEEENETEDTDSEGKEADEEVEEEREGEEVEEVDFAEVKQAIDFAAIKKIAVRYRAKELDTSATTSLCVNHQLSCEIDPEPMCGGFNLIYIVRWLDGVKWVVRIPRHGYRFEPNHLRRPEACRAGCNSKPHGRTLYFDQDETEPRVGPAIEMSRNGSDDIWGSPVLKPRYGSLKAALSEWLEDLKYRTKRSECQRSILRIAIDSIPGFLESQDRYTLSPPDFDWQNAMVNDTGEVTGFTDWDNAEVTPLAAGTGRYPRWLMRDWQPSSYDGEEDEDQVDDDGTTWRDESPEKLSSYRQHYLKAMMACQGPDYDPRWTGLSHILETVSIGVYDKVSAGCNIQKLFQHAGISFELVDYAESYMRDDTAEKDRLIREAFKNMWHAEWEAREALKNAAANTLEDIELYNTGHDTSGCSEQ